LLAAVAPAPAEPVVRPYVPGGATVHSFEITDYTTVRKATSDDQRVVADRAVVPQNIIRWITVSNGTVALTYLFDGSAFVADVNPQGNVFAYSLTSGTATSLTVARVPSP
jgi:hypothetical protein